MYEVYFSTEVWTYVDKWGSGEDVHSGFSGIDTVYRKVFGHTEYISSWGHDGSTSEILSISIYDRRNFATEDETRAHLVKLDQLVEALKRDLSGWNVDGSHKELTEID